MSEYSPLKVFHHQKEIDLLKKGQHIAPKQVQLILSDLCNQSCSFCAYRMDGYSSNELFTLNAPLAAFGHNNPKRWIPYYKVNSILTDCKYLGVKAIQLTGGGEPSVHPQFSEIVENVLEMDFDLALVTNGLAIKNADLARLAQNASWVRVSIDSGSAKTYSEIRRVGLQAYDRVWTNVRYLVNIKKTYNSDTIIGLGFVITKENVHEIQQFAALAVEAGVDNVRYSAMFQNDDTEYYDGKYENIKDALEETKQKYGDKVTIFDNFGDRYADLEQKHPDYSYCGYQRFTTYIGADLNVYRCCVLAYNTRGIIGNLKDISFRNLWLDTAKKNFDEFDATGCPRCMFNNKNRTILYALEENPKHVNFV